jgi:phosphopantetheine--protein transferase-like protein
MHIGTDIVDVKRIPADNLAFIHGVLSHNEIILLGERAANRKAEFIAGRYAAKEAFLKGLGTGLAGAKFNDIDVHYREGGQPVLSYQGQDYEVSISHDGDYAIAVVLIP